MYVDRENLWFVVTFFFGCTCALFPVMWSEHPECGHVCGFLFLFCINDTNDVIFLLSLEFYTMCVKITDCFRTVSVSVVMALVLFKDEICNNFSHVGSFSIK